MSKSLTSDNAELLRRGAELENEIRRLLEDAKYEDYLSRIVIDFDSLEALREACQVGDVDMVELLLNSGISPNTRETAKWTALHTAAYGGHLESVKLLVERGADVNARLYRIRRRSKRLTYGWMPLHSAALRGHVEVARYLLDGGVVVDAEYTQYFTAIRSKDAIEMARDYGEDQVLQLLL